MATLTITNIQNNQVDWVISGLSAYWDDGNFQRMVLCEGYNGSAPYGILDTRYPPTSGTGYGFTETCTGLNSGTYYYVYAFALAQNGSWYQVGGGTSFTTGSNSPPNPPTNLISNVISKSQINLGWTVASGAQGYNVFRNGYYIGYTTNNYYVHSGLSEYTQYSFHVRSTRSGLESYDSEWVYARTLDQTDPYVSISGSTLLNTRISISWSSGDSHSGRNYHEVFISKKGGSDLYWKDQLSSGASTYNFEYDADGLPLEGGKTYRVGVRVYDLADNYSSMASNYYTTQSSRPANWSWFTSKVSGGTSNGLTYDEWNKFCSRINDFRNYKGLPSYGFTDASQGGIFYAYLFNQARSGINDLSRTVSVPTSVTSGEDVYAYQLNQLRDALNSTT